MLDEDTEDGEFARQQISKELEAQVVGLIDSAGCLLGYRYEDSSICVKDGSAAPPDHPQIYWPTSRPGHRAPHVWLEPKISLLDKLDRDFTLLRFDQSVDVTPLLSAANAQGMPLKLVDIDDQNARQTYEKSLVIVRPDLMSAWRSDQLPEDCAGLIDCLRGA